MTMRRDQRRDRKKTLSAVIPHIVQNHRGYRFFLSRLGSWLKSVILHVLFFILKLKFIQNFRDDVIF